MSTWISVEERLPEKRDKSYQLITCAKKVYEQHTNYPGEGIKAINQDWVVRQWPQNFTHWAEMPKFKDSGCSLCGSTSIHACTGSPIEPWTPEKIAELNAVLSEYETEPTKEKP